MKHTYEITVASIYRITSDKLLSEGEAVAIYNEQGGEFVEVQSSAQRELPIQSNGKPFPRYCSVTGEGVIEGWLCFEALKVFKHRSDAAAYLRNECDYKGSDDKILEDACDDDFCFWTEWSDDDIRD